MKSIEQRGRSVEDAVEQALAQLGVGLEQVEVEVLEEQKGGGLFGLLGQPSVKVRVTIKEESEPQSPPSPVTPEPEEPGAAEAPTPDAPTADDACALVQSILDKMETAATATVIRFDDAAESGGREVLIDLVGDDVAILIGKYGQTLYALQYLVNVILNRGKPNSLKVLLDAQGYRQRREESLKRIARNAAARALRQGRKVKLEPLPVHERRIIHLTLQDDKAVFTYSEGVEPRRCVIIAPTEESRRRDERRGRQRGGFGRQRGRYSERRPAPRDTSEWDDAWAQFESQSSAETDEENIL